MLSIRVDLLTDRYYATAFNDRNRAEWPPHPGRLFSALVAVWAEGEGPSEDESELLRWLEDQGAPELTCSGHDEVAFRDVHTVFVPVNDASIHSSLDSHYTKLVEADSAATVPVDDPKAHEKALKAVDKALVRARAASAREADKASTGSKNRVDLLPDERGRQPRTFPCVTPEEPTVYFTWPEVEPSDHQIRVLDDLLSRLGRLGHSSSFVAASLTTEPPESTFRPQVNGETQMRVPAPGLLAALESSYAQHGGREPRILPNVIVPYGCVTEPPPVPTGQFSDNWFLLWIVPEDERPDDGAATAPADHGRPGPSRRIHDVPINASLSWTRAVRSALQSHASDEHKAYMGGHHPDGTRLEEVHPAIIPLGFVGTDYADGRVRAFAIVPPVDITDERVAAIGRALRRWEAHSRGMVLYTDRRSEAILRPAVDTDLPSSIRTREWVRPSTTWSTATPIVLDRFPKGFNHKDPEVNRRAVEQVEQIITRAVSIQGLPEPRRIHVTNDGVLRGSGPVRTFRAYRHGRNSTSRPLSVHATVEFDEAVRGPLIIGGGRYLGYGLMKPLMWGGS